MRIRNLFILIFIALSISTCDEFLLKKTVTLASMDGELVFDADDLTIKGDLTYSIKNNQLKSLTEIYLVCHPSVSVNFITYNDMVMQFEQAVGYGYGIYRIKIPDLKSGKKASIGLEFVLQGPVSEDRFILTEDLAFFDASEIWLPVPFADAFNFTYTLNIRTPEEYYSILGAEIIDESVDNGKRSVTWQSELDDSRTTGNLIIGKFQRYSEDNIYFYSEYSNNTDLVFEYADFTIQTLSDEVYNYPFEQSHIVNSVFQYVDMEEFVDGEFFANTILLSLGIFSNTNYITASKMANSCIPIIPSQSEIHLFELLAHELTHAYSSAVLNFEDEDYLSGESLTEFLAIEIIRNKYPGMDENFRNYLRILMINLQFNKQSDTRFWDYLYGVTVLSSAFKDTSNLGFYYLDILIEKYRYTEITINELVSTAQGINNELTRDSDVSDQELIGMNIMNLWTSYDLYNIGLEIEESIVTNMVYDYTNFILKVKNEFPVAVDGYLFITEDDSHFSNYITLKKSSTTNFVLDNDIGSVSFQSRFEFLESKMADNEVLIHSNRIEETIVDDINAFYQDTTESIRAFGIADNETDFVFKDHFNWQNPYDSRLNLNGDMHFEFIYDDSFGDSDELYITARKTSNGKDMAYVIFKFKKKRNGTYQWIGVYDPSSLLYANT